MEASVVGHVRAGVADFSAVPDMWAQAVKVLRIIAMIVIMIFLIQQWRKIESDPGYIDRVVDMITDGTSVEQLEGK